MRDVKSFCKLFDLNVPSYEDFDYYRSLYRRVGRHSDIDELVAMYEELEETVDDMFAYRMECTNRLVDYIESTRAFNDLNLDPMVPDLPVNKSFEFKEGTYYVSFDLIKANWQAVKSYDPEFVNELGESWAALVDSLGIPPLFARSKQLRQYVFGNLNPKRLMKVQRRMVEMLMNTLPTPDCVRHDEVILSFDDLSMANALAAIGGASNFKSSVFTVDVRDGYRINNYIDQSENVYDREPVGCNGHRYFMVLKQEVLGEPLDVRDLYFRMEGELAVWKVPGVEIKLI
jgi:hypothetical protein